MQDLLLMVGPIAAVAYFLVYPNQFNSLLAWAVHFVH